MLFNLNFYASPSMKAAMNWFLGLLGKPELKYLELHLTDHCNLGCKGCGHYSPLAPPNYADLRQYENDMQRLRQLFRNIRKIRLMGGEPLLHHDPASFITVTRASFPESNIHFVTNGILLPKATAKFWDACRNTNTTIAISVYPPTSHHLEEWRTLCEAERVTLSVAHNVTTFFAFHNFKGDTDMQDAFKRCRSRYYCPFLREGRLYTCGVPALVHYLNESSGSQIVADRGIDIHSKKISGRWILRQLNRPIETCKWCSNEFVPFTWSASNKISSEWDATKHKR